MGGEVRIVYREENGTVHTRTRHTNPMGRFLKSHRIAERDHDWMMHYFSPQFALDYSYSKADTDPVPCAPHHYGIVVVDFRANQFMSAQDYTSLDRIAPAEATGEFYRPEHREEAIQNFTDMPDGRLRIREKVFRTFQQNTTHSVTLGDLLTREEAAVEAKNMMRRYREQHNPFRERVDTSVTPEIYYDTNFHIEFDPLDTSLLNNDDDSTTLLLIKNRMLETGFVFTDDEHMIWDKGIKEAMSRRY